MQQQCKEECLFRKNSLKYTTLVFVVHVGLIVFAWTNLKVAATPQASVSWSKALHVRFIQNQQNVVEPSTPAQPEQIHPVAPLTPQPQANKLIEKQITATESVKETKVKQEQVVQKTPKTEQVQVLQKTHHVKNTVTLETPENKTPSVQPMANAAAVSNTSTQNTESNTARQAAHSLNHARDDRAATTAPSHENTTVKALTRRVNYPIRAKSLGVEGRVKVLFDITENGTVQNIRILSESPPDVFASNVKKDMTRWRYQTSRALSNQTVTIIFKLDGHVKLEN
ncbi:MAG: TonB family protein [Acinetobacter sp.]